jgi:hypothetical protein
VSEIEEGGDQLWPGERLNRSLPCGFWAGVPVEDVPTAYLCWAMRTLPLRPELRDLIHRVLQDRYDAWRQSLADRARARKELRDRVRRK